VARGKQCFRRGHEYVVGVDWNIAYVGDRVKLKGSRVGVITGVSHPIDDRHATVTVKLFDPVTGKDKGEAKGHAVTLGIRLDRSAP